MRRFLPNVLVTGTPGTGKTSFCELIASDIWPATQEKTVTHVKVGEAIRENRLYSEWDDEFDVPVFDEEAVLSYLEPIVESGGTLVDFHTAEFIPASWLDLIVVLRADTDVLYDRLERRGYSERKIQENVQSEIFDIVLDEVRTVFEDKVEIWVYPNNTIADQEALAEKLMTRLCQKK